MSCLEGAGGGSITHPSRRDVPRRQARMAAGFPTVALRPIRCTSCTVFRTSASNVGACLSPPPAIKASSTRAIQRSRISPSAPRGTRAGTQLLHHFLVDVVKLIEVQIVADHDEARRKTACLSLQEGQPCHKGLATPVAPRRN